MRLDATEWILMIFGAMLAYIAFAPDYMLRTIFH
jgi:hypothetical protein